MNLGLGYPTSGTPQKKVKMPHRHGEFEQRRMACYFIAGE
jgi:hypothetical protein